MYPGKHVPIEATIYLKRPIRIRKLSKKEPLKVWALCFGPDSLLQLLYT